MDIVLAETRAPGAGGDSRGSPILVPPDVAVWAAIHTKPRAERKVLEALARRGVRTFLPMVTRRRTYGARVRVSRLPLFGGYLFHEFEPVGRIETLRTYGVVRVLETKDPQRLARELQDLARLLLVEGVTPVRVNLGPPGTPVEVVAGSLVGLRGELVRQTGATRLVIKIKFLDFGAAVDIDESSVRRIEAAPLEGTAARHDGDLLA